MQREFRVYLEDVLETATFSSQFSIGTEILC